MGEWELELAEARGGRRAYPFPITVLMLLMRSAQIRAIEPDNRDCED
jgi:hypothetical protein